MYLILGDSWSQGEWSQETDAHHVTHGGLSQYLKESNRSVINIGSASSSNNDNVVRLRRFFDSGINEHLQQPLGSTVEDKILFFQTNWWRDFSPLSPQDDPQYNFVGTIDNEIQNRSLSRFYYQLSQISQSKQIPIFIIGGASDTIWIDKFSIEYPGISIACQSFTNLCINNEDRIAKPFLGGISVRAAERLIKIQPGSDTTSLLEKLLDDTHTRLNVYKKNPDWFYPDGVHPNRKGHKKLFNLLINKHIVT